MAAHKSRRQTARKKTAAPVSNSSGSSGKGKDARAILIRVNADGLKAIRLLAAAEDTTTQALGIEALNDLLHKRGLPRSIRNPLLDEE